MSNGTELVGLMIEHANGVKGPPYEVIDLDESSRFLRPFNSDTNSEHELHERSTSANRVASQIHTRICN